jgi:NinB protein
MAVSRCPTCRRKMTRSSEANRRLWALYHAMSERIHPAEQTYSAEQWHLWAKSKYLGAEDHVLPNGKTITIPNSTAGLDTAAFDAFMTQVEAFANERGCFLEDMEGAP